MAVVVLQPVSSSSSTGVVLINRAIDSDLTVLADHTLLLRDPVLASGVTITIETDGEVYTL